MDPLTRPDKLNPSDQSDQSAQQLIPEILAELRQINKRLEKIETYFTGCGELLELSQLPDDLKCLYIT